MLLCTIHVAASYHVHHGKSQMTGPHRSMTLRVLDEVHSQKYLRSHVLWFSSFSPLHVHTCYTYGGMCLCIHVIHMGYMCMCIYVIHVGVCVCVCVLMLHMWGVCACVCT